MTNAAVTPLPERSTDWTIGKNVAYLLLRSEETQAKLANVLGMSPQLLSHKLKGRRPWTAQEIEGAARHYRVTIDSLFRKLPDLDSNQEPAVSMTAAGTRDELAAYRQRHTHLRPLLHDNVAPVAHIGTRF